MRKPISEKKLLALIQQFTAIDAVGPSAIRGQPQGSAQAIHGYLGKIDLSRIPRVSRRRFASWLDLHTARIQRKLPNRRKPWGVARKTLNLFLRGCFYNHYLRDAYGLAKVGLWLEVPLDSVVVQGLKKDTGRGVLPRWQGLGRLSPEDSQEYQSHARAYAAECQLPATVFLDNYLWLRGRRPRTAR